MLWYYVGRKVEEVVQQISPTSTTWYTQYKVFFTWKCSMLYRLILNKQCSHIVGVLLLLLYHRFSKCFKPIHNHPCITAAGICLRATQLLFFINLSIDKLILNLFIISDSEEQIYKCKELRFISEVVKYIYIFNITNMSLRKAGSSWPLFFNKGYKHMGNIQRITTGFFLGWECIPSCSSWTAALLLTRVQISFPGKKMKKLMILLISLEASRGDDQDEWENGEGVKGQLQW